jgi:hypothetical protein
MRLPLWTSVLVLLSLAMVSFGAPAAATAPEAATQTGGEIKMAPSVDYPHAGIALAVPEVFEYRSPANLTDVMQAVQTENDRPGKMISVSAIPVEAQETADSMGQRIVADLRKNLSFRHLSELHKMPWPIAGQPGTARLLSYSFQGHDYVAIQVCFLRDIDSPKLRIAYLLSVEVAKSYQPQLTALLRQVSNSIRMTPVRQTSSLPVEQLDKPLEDKRLGYSLRPPRGWFVRPVQDGLVMGMADYVLNLPAPTLRASVQGGLPLLTSSNECAQKLAMMEKELAETKEKFDKLLALFRKFVKKFVVLCKRDAGKIGLQELRIFFPVGI